MTNIDELQARREELLKRLDNIQRDTWGDWSDHRRIEYVDALYELKRLTSEMLDALRSEQAGGKHEDTWRYCDRLSAFVMDLEARVHKMEQREEAVAGGTPADTVPADKVETLSTVAAMAFEVIDGAIEDGQVSGETIYADDWAGLRDELEAAGRDVENALAGRVDGRPVGDGYEES